jgi:hypothetical protein
VNHPARFPLFLLAVEKYFDAGFLQHAPAVLAEIDNPHLDVSPRDADMEEMLPPPAVNADFHVLMHDMPPDVSLNACPFSFAPT